LQPCIGPGMSAPELWHGRRGGPYRNRAWSHKFLL
jgi:hypothetical protein